MKSSTDTPKPKKPLLKAVTPPVRICEEADDPHVALQGELMQVIQERSEAVDLTYQGIYGALEECKFLLDQERYEDE